MDNTVIAPSKEHSVPRRRRKQVEVKRQINDETILASSSGDVVWLEQTLRTNFQKAFSQTKEQGFSTIHMAAMNGHLGCLKVLVEKQSVPVDCESNTGWRAIHLSINNKNKSRSLKCLNYLLKQGADPSKPNHRGFTPVHQAAIVGHVDCLRSLIDAGATINTPDSESLTPVDYARIWGHRLCVRILNDRQWHIDKNSELVNTAKHAEENVKTKKELQIVHNEVDKMKVEQNKAAFDSWLMNKGLPTNELEHYRPFSTKVVPPRSVVSTTKTKKSPSPTLPMVDNGGLLKNSVVREKTPAPPPVDNDEPNYHYSNHKYFDEFELDKRLELIPLDKDSTTKRKQRAQDTFRAMRDNT